MHAKPDFRPAADSVMFAPAETLTPTPTTVRPNRRKKGEDPWMTDEYKMFAGHDGLLVRTVLVRASSYREEKDIVRIDMPNDITRLCAHMQFLDQEHIVVLTMNSRNEVAAIYEASIGPSNAAGTTAVDILKVPILSGCRSLILIHNHPGGDPKPSQADLEMTKAVVRAGTCMGITVLDHVIIARRGSFSFVEHGVMPS